MGPNRLDFRLRGNDLGAHWHRHSKLAVATEGNAGCHCWLAQQCSAAIPLQLVPERALHRKQADAINSLRPSAPLRETLFYAAASSQPHKRKEWTEIIIAISRAI